MEKLFYNFDRIKKNDNGISQFLKLLFSIGKKSWVHAVITAISGIIIPILWDGEHYIASVVGVLIMSLDILFAYICTEYQGRLYYMPLRKIRERSEELLEFCGLIDYRKRTVRKLSGGMKRKLMVCRALLTEPEILLLDEPTAGMDAFARRQMWNLLKKLNQQKLTILLTTHYMEEAETLCDRVGFMCGGRLEETDAPGHMIETLGRYAVDETSPDGLKSHYFHGKEEAIQYLSASEQETALRSTTLEDVFLETIGQQLECR